MATFKSKKVLQILLLTSFCATLSLVSAGEMRDKLLEAAQLNMRLIST